MTDLEFRNTNDFLRCFCPNNTSWCKTGEMIPEDGRQHNGLQTDEGKCPHYYRGKCTHVKHPRNQTDAIQVWHDEAPI